MRIMFDRGSLDGNHHICTRRPYGQTLDGFTHEFRVKRGPAVSLVQLGAECWETAKGRTVIGWRLWFYAPSGRCWNLDVALVFDVSPYPPGSKYAPRLDAPDGAFTL